MLFSRSGQRNLITDVPGILVGNAEDHDVRTGVTVLTSPQPFVAGVHIMGGAPGTAETDLLAPDKLVDRVDALVLSGGSAFGLAAADGVRTALRKAGRGYQVGGHSVPIVPTAILYDLNNGGQKNWSDATYQRLGQEALNNAALQFSLGNIGAGTGAQAGTRKGGLGSCSLLLEGGIHIGALVAVNAVGSAATPDGGHFWAAPFEMHAEFGGKGLPSAVNGLAVPGIKTSVSAQENTTIAIIATDAKLDKAGAQRLSIAAHDGFARALVPAHTPFDGDLVFTAATGEHDGPITAELMMQLCHAASVCMARAIARGVYEAAR